MYMNLRRTNVLSLHWLNPKFSFSMIILSCMSIPSVYEFIPGDY